MHDGTVYWYSANDIAVKIFSQWDNEGRQQAVMREITDHRKENTAVDITNGYTTTKRGKRVPKTTTWGWQLLCLWRDGSSDWVDLKYLKQSKPIELAEYAVANRLQQEPAIWVFTDSENAKSNNCQSEE